jgi:hypothetical protein
MYLHLSIVDNMICAGRATEKFAPKGKLLSDCDVIV